MRGVTWRRDDHRSAYVCSDGRVVTDENIARLDPFVAAVLLQVLREACR